MTGSYAHRVHSYLRSHFVTPVPDIEILRERKDVKSLMRLLHHPDTTVQWKAAEALGTFGPDVVEQLFCGLYEYGNLDKLGTIEALAAIKDKRAVIPLSHLLCIDESAEIRFACALALGELGDPAAIESLCKSLIERDKYVRFGSAVALKKLGWIARTYEETANYYIALEQWDIIPHLGLAAAGPVIRIMTSPDPDIRLHAVEIIEMIHPEGAKYACDLALRDDDSKVRWHSVLAARECGIPFQFLPWSLNERKRYDPHPGTAALLNFVFGGVGYYYLNYWWWMIAFQVYYTVFFMATIYPINYVKAWSFFVYLSIPGIPVPIPVSIVLAVHAWYLTVHRSSLQT